MASSSSRAPRLHHQQLTTQPARIFAWKQHLFAAGTQSSSSTPTIPWPASSIASPPKGRYAKRTLGLVLSQLIERHSSSLPSVTSLEQAPLIYGRLAEQIAYSVGALNRHGYGRGDRVVLVLPNGPQLAVAFLGISAGAQCAPLNPAYSAQEFTFFLKDLEASVLVTQPGFCPAAEAAARQLGVPLIALQPSGEFSGLFTLEGEISRPLSSRSGFSEPEEVALLLHSSGTTARPKLIPLTHRNLTVSARQIHATLALTPADHSLNVMPLFHVHGLIGALLATLSAGGSICCTTGFNALRFYRWLDQVQPTWYTAVPTMHQAILARVPPTGFRHRLRLIRSSSAHLHTSVWNELENVFGCPALNSYGMTEGAHQIASNPLPPGQRKRGTVGPATGPTLCILDPAGNLLPAGRTGEVALRGETITVGYIAPESANQMAFTNGWLRTGDLGVQDDDGYLSLTGRLKEIINCGGEKVSPAEIDTVLMDHPFVSMALTFPIKCTMLGEKIGAVIVLKIGCAAAEADLKVYAGERLARFKVPRKIVFRDDIPKGPTGKMQRHGMAARLGLE